jgi:uncharacterized protein (TIGR00725 family)
MKRIIGVMGPGEKQASKNDLELAYEAGKLIAESGAVLLCGAMSGVMEACAKGAQEAGGLTLGIGPVTDKSELNPYIDIPVMTGMGPARNFVNIISSDLLIFISVGSPGTLSELAFAMQMKKDCIVTNGSENLKAYISELDSGNVIFADSLEIIKERL